MASRSETLELIIRARDIASTEFRRVNQALGTIESRIKSVINLKTGLASLFTGLAIKSFIEAANESARAVAGLDTALRSMGRYTPELSKKLQDLAASFQTTTNFEDDAIIQGQKFLVTYLQISDELLPRTTKTMLDLAALMGGDTVQAANMLGKASMGMTDQLRRVGISVDENVFKMQGFTGVLSQIEAQVSGQAEAMRRATGPWITLKNVFGGLREEIGFVIKSIADAIGEDLVNALNVGIEYIKRFREGASFEEWAREARTSIIDTFEKMLLGAAGFYDAVLPILRDLKSALSTIIDVWKELPTWVQEVGIVAAILGGKKIAAAILGISFLIGTANKASKAVRAMRDDLISWEEWRDMSQAQRDAFIKALDEAEGFTEQGGQIIRQKIQKPVQDVFDELAKAGTATEKIKVLLQYLRQLREEREKSAKGPAAAFTPKALASVDYKLIKAQDEAFVDRLKESTKTALLILETTYKDGRVKLEEYFAERKALIGKVFDAEIEQVEKAIKRETDAAAKVGLETKLIALREAYTRDLIELDQERGEIQKKLDEQEAERARILQAMKLRTMEDASATLQAVFTKELAEMDLRHKEEIKRLQELKAAKAEIDEAEMTQKLEKEQLLFDQERRLMEERLQLASDVAAGMAGIFEGLYETTGKKHKEFFYLAKAAAIAEAVINTLTAVTKALSQGGIWGIVQAAVIEAKGMIQVAKIRSQSLAEGGLIQGISAHAEADDKLIAATAGEFVLPVRSVKHYGLETMEAVRQRVATILTPKNFLSRINIPAPSSPRFGFAEGGQVGAGSARGGLRDLVIANFYDLAEFGRFLATAKGQDAVVNVLAARRDTVRRVIG